MFIGGRTEKYSLTCVFYSLSLFPGISLFSHWKEQAEDHQNNVREIIHVFFSVQPRSQNNRQSEHVSLLMLRQSPLCSLTLFDEADIMMPCCSDAWEWWGGIPPPPTHESFDLDVSLNHSHNPKNTHFNTPPPSSPYHYSSLWNHFTCILFLSWRLNSSRWDRIEYVEEEWSEEVTTARVHSRLSEGLPCQVGGSVPLPIVFRRQVSPEEVYVSHVVGMKSKSWKVLEALPSQPWLWLLTSWKVSRHQKLNWTDMHCVLHKKSIVVCNDLACICSCAMLLTLAMSYLALVPCPWL